MQAAQVIPMAEAPVMELVRLELEIKKQKAEKLENLVNLNQKLKEDAIEASLSATP